LDKKTSFSWCRTNLDTQRNFAFVLTARLLTFLFTFFHPIATVSTSSAEFENYVFSRGGNRLIRTVLIASNGRTFFFIFSTSQNFFVPLSLSSFLLFLPGASARLCATDASYCVVLSQPLLLLLLLSSSSSSLTQLITF